MHQLNNFNSLLYSAELLKFERNSLTVHIKQWMARWFKKKFQFLEDKLLNQKDLQAFLSVSNSYC